MSPPAHELAITVLMIPDMTNFSGIRVLIENIRTQALRHASSCFFTMVAVDDECKPVAVPSFRRFLYEQKQPHSGVFVRKEMRQKF